jgi:hypothetical protein
VNAKSPAAPSLGLGEKTPDVALIREEYPLPSNRKEIVDLLANVLAGGGVQKVVIALKEPMIVTRAVPKGDERVPTEIPPDELLQAARFSEIFEIPSPDDIPSHEYLFKGFAWLKARRLVGRALIVHSDRELRSWLKVDDFFDVSTVYGIDTKVDAELPEDTALLLGSLPGSPDKIVAGLRLLMNLRPLRGSK